jgi:signal transduction histidine kinase
MIRKSFIWFIYIIFFFSFSHISGQNNSKDIQNTSSALIFSVVSEIAANAGIDSIKHQDIFTAIFKISDGHRLHGDYSKAMEYDFSALELAEVLNYQNQKARAYNNIAISYYRMQSYEKAEELFLRAAAIQSSLKDTLRLADIYYNMGMLYDDIGKFDESLLSYQKSLELFKKKNIYDGMADAYNGMAGHYYMLGNIDSVEFYATKALEMFIVMDRKDAVAFMHINIGAMQNVKGQHDEALQNIQKGIRIAEETKNLNQLRQGYKGLSETYASMGEYKNAYFNYKIYEQYKDSIFNNEKAGIIEELQTKYETDKALKELNEKKAEILQMEVDVQKSKNVRNVFILGLAILVVLTAAIWLRYVENQKVTSLLNTKNSELEELNSTKDKFFSLISHDMKSPVTSMARLASGLEKSIDHIDRQDLKNYLSEISRTTENLNDLLKKLLEWALSQKSGFKPIYETYRIDSILSEVIDTARTQANLKNINIECNCHTDLQLTVDKRMIQTVLRNLLSNALKFSNNDASVYVKTFKENGGVKISVINSGPGIRVEDVHKLFSLEGQAGLITNHAEKGSGLGLILCHEFVKLHGGKVFIESHTPENTCFSFIIPGKKL